MTQSNLAVEMATVQRRIVCGKYELIRQLGSGGSGDVFEARNLAINKRVAVKILRRSAGSASVAERETLAAVIESRNVVDIYDIATDGPSGALVIAMEFLEGSNLGTLVEHHGRLNEPEAVTVLRQCLAGISSAHERGVVHGDLKPNNVFCVQKPGEERVVVLDFGVASLVDGAAAAEMTTTLGGTPLWMDPDTLRGRQRTRASDTWAIGLLAYFALVGRTYWTARDHRDLFDEIVARDARPTAQDLGGYPTWFRRFVELAIGEDWRHATPASLLEALPQMPAAVPVLRSAHGSEVPTSFELGATIIYGPPPTAPESDRTIEDVLRHDLSEGALQLEEFLPDAMRRYAPQVAAFLGASCHEHLIDADVIRLRRPLIQFAAAYEFFLVALASSRVNSIKTITFVGYTRGLEEKLQKLDPNKLKVVIVLVDATELGVGVRARIAELFRSYRAALIPAFIGDVAALKTADDVRAWLSGRWSVNRPATNPFEPGVVDRTLLRGQGVALGQLVQDLVAGPAALSVYGAPGTGKSTLVRRAERELSDEARMFWISCASLPAGGAALEFARRAAQAFGIPFEVRDGRPVDSLEAGLAKVVGADPAGRATIVVLDDADALAEPTLLGLAAADHTFLDELRRTIARLLGGGGIRFVFIGLRVFKLSHEELLGALNPLRPYVRLRRLPACTQEEISELCDLGHQVDLRFEPDAQKSVFSWSFGNMNIAQMICSQILTQLGAVNPVAVQEQHVEAAAKELIAARQSFERRLMPWLTPAEQLVLAAIPRTSFKRPLELAAALGNTSDEEVGNALDCLVEMGVLVRPAGRTRVAGPLIEQWVLTHMSTPQPLVGRKRERGIQYAALGLLLTALLLAAGNKAMAEGQQKVQITSEKTGCTTTASLPERVALNEMMVVNLFRQCAAPQVGTVTLRGDGDTPAWFGKPNAEGHVPHEAKKFDLNVTEPTDRFQGEVGVVIAKAVAGAAYEFLLIAEDKRQRITVRKNWLKELSYFGKAIVYAAGALPALLGVLLGFYTDIRDRLSKLLSRG